MSAFFAICSLIIAIGAFIGVRYFIGSILGPEKAEVSMPNLVGKTLAEEEAEAAKRGGKTESEGDL